jgi:hypothetical protein
MLVNIELLNLNILFLLKSISHHEVETFLSTVTSNLFD